MTDLESSLRQRLLDAQNDFLTIHDNAALHAFSERWAVLCDDFEQALQTQTLDDSLKSLAHSVAYRVATLAEAQQELTDAFMIELDTLFAELSLESIQVVVPKQHLPPPQPSSHRPATTSTLPYYSLAYDWLMLNIHDPYPSKALKDLFAASAKVKPRLIESWFKSVRKQIGWDALRQIRFKGSRSFTVAAALRCFNEDINDLPFNIATELRAMRGKAKSLFPSHTTLPSPHRRSTSASSLDTVHSTVTETTAPSPSSSSRALSRPPSLVFSSSESDEDEGLSEPVLPSQEVHEQREPFREPRSSPLPESFGHVQLTDGRSHSSHGVSDFNGDACLSIPGGEMDGAIRPLPSGGTEGVASPWSPSSSESIGPSGNTPHAMASLASKSDSRKRRRSDADLWLPSKRCKMAGLSRPHAVSAPLPQLLDLQSALAALQQDPAVADFQSHSRGETETSKCVDFGVLDETYLVAAHRQTMVDMWAGDTRPLSEIVEDAPSSTTLKLLPLPDIDASSHRMGPDSIEPGDGNVEYAPPSVTFRALAERELPPIHWSSSSLAGALGPLEQASVTQPEPSATLDNDPSPLHVGASLETEGSEPHTSSPCSLQATIPELNRDVPSGEAILFQLEAESYEHASLQELLDLLGAPPYASGFAF